MRGRRIAVTAVLGLVLSFVGSETVGLDIQEIYIFEGTDRTNGVADDYFFEVEINGTGLVDGVFVCVDTATWYPLTVSGGGTEAEFNESFGSMAALLTDHPNPATGGYHFYFNQTKPSPGLDDFEDHVLLGFGAAAPTGFATITNPTHGETGVGLNPTYTWSDVSGAGAGYLGSWVCDMAADTDVFEQVDTNMSRTSWTPGALAPSTSYEIELCVMNASGGGPLSLATAQSDAFTYYGIFEDNNINTFETIPEPISVCLFGTAALMGLGLRHRRRMG